MKEKRMYTNKKEHGEDMTHENESKTIHRELADAKFTPLDMSALITQHNKEIWEWKQKESKWLEDRGELDLTLQIEKLQARIKQLDESLANALEINENHQRYNGKLQIRISELERDNRILSKQISDYIKKHEDSFRKAGM